IAPAVRAKNEDIVYTIAVVLMFGLLALFVFPFIGHWLDLSPNQFGAFAGVGIVNSAQVLAAGFAFSNDAGVVAGVYNIGRVICLPLVVLMLAIMVAAEDARVHSQLANTSKMRIILDKFPVFVLGFLAVVLLNTFGFMSKEEAKMASNFMNWCFLLGFSSIGLTTHLSDIKAAGLSGALIGFCVASVKAGLALLVVLCFLQ
ncbi:YeiH family protein, partial [Desulfovibrio piger]|uniref:YeiH family protein n=1 Tax=Desulfovibrio piger TaxID=901 RepID=UPI0026F04270